MIAVLHLIVGIISAGLAAINTVKNWKKRKSEPESNDEATAECCGPESEPEVGGFRESLGGFDVEVEGA